MARPFVVATIGILSLWRASAQPAHASFQVVSVKPAQNVTAISITPRRSGDRVTYVTEIRMVIYYAYRLAPFQVSGDLPNGVYEIQAIADGSPTDDELRQMFQRLLEDRFALKVHTETRPMRAYELLAAKGGPRLDAAQPGGGKIFNGRPGPDGVGAFVTREGPRLEGRNASMAQLAEALTRSLQAPVVDRTGLSGTYDFNLAFSKEEPEKPAADGSDMPRAPSLDLAIQQLGLKLQSGKAPSQILVIDHVTPPTDN
jgi:uncharacterized protein (TIGR03435 family)